MTEERSGDRARDLLEGYEHALSIPVAWGDMDAYRHVNNVSYFRYQQSGRIAYFEKLGFVDEGRAKALQIRPILASTGCRFKAPMTYPDTAHVGIRIERIGEDRFVIHHAVASEKLGRIAAEGESVVVSYDYDRLEKVPLPEEWRKRLEKAKKSEKA